MGKRVLSRGALVVLVLLLVASLLVPSCASQPAASPTAAGAPTAAEPAATTPAGAAPTTAAAPTQSSAGAKQTGGVLKILGTFKPTIFGYPPESSGGSTYVQPGPFEPILNFDSNLNFQPTGLATGFEIAKDGSSATIKLRSGVKFHDGTEFNAEAVKWNFEAAQKAKSAGTTNWDTIEVVDNLTVKINLKQYDAAFPALLGRTLGFMVSPTAVEKNGLDWIRQNPVSTGPYKFKEFVRDVSLTYERFDDYWGGKPAMDGIQWLFVADEMVQMTSFQAGEAQVLYQASAQQAKELEGKGYQKKMAMTQLATLVPDSANPDSPLSKEKVRQALEYAVDRKTIADALGMGTWAAVDQPGLKDYPLAYDPNLKGREYDPAKAKALLAEAGYPDGFKIRIITDVAYKAQDSLVAIQKYWKDVGVDCEIETIQRSKMDEYRQKGWTNGFVYTQMVLDPMYLNTLERFLSTTNKSVYFSAARPEGWTEAFNAAKGAIEQTDLQNKTKGMVKTLQEQASILPLWTIAYIIFMDETVHDTGFLEKYHSLLWSPETAWLSKK